jgi:FAD synthase
MYPKHLYLLLTEDKTRKLQNHFSLYVLFNSQPREFLAQTRSNETLMEVKRRIEETTQTCTIHGCTIIRVSFWCEFASTAGTK